MKSALVFLIAARRCEINDLEQLALASALVRVVGRMVHALQKERGISNVYLASKGTRFAAQLKQQILECADVQAELRASFDNLDTVAGHLGNGARLFSRIAYALHGLDGLSDLRQRIRGLTISAQEATGAFVGLIAGLLAVVFEAADSASNPEISRLLVAMFNFMQGKEFSGQERALGAAAFAAGRMNPQSQQKWVELIQSQDQCVQVFTDFATPQLHELWQNGQSPTLLAELERLRRIACFVGSGTLDPDLSQTWFDCCTRRIEAMKTVEDQLAADLLKLCGVKIAQARAGLHDQQIIVAALTSAVQAASTSPSSRLDGTAPPYGYQLGRSIFDMVRDQASRLQAMSDELEAARASLNERKLVERAKGLLMAHRKLSEEDAYKMLRQTAMSQNKRLKDVAEAVLAMADYLSSNTT